MTGNTHQDPEERHAHLIRVFTALGAADPQAWADSEMGEDIPQLARFLFLRCVRQVVAQWEQPGAVEQLLADPRSPDALAQFEAAGIEPRTLALFASRVAHATAFDLAYRLADSDFVDHDPQDPDGYPPRELRDELPGWCLVESTPTGEHTDRHLDSLHEDIGGLWEEFTAEFEPRRGE
ncbi:hypothetical protein NE857_22085 [Nocardiopsis exhalans]|uniref:Uncharacterized protein n=2 Tax=Nocardiopsis TaxID=2013 RepID=A0A840WMV8_9ACTN|nr:MULTISPECIES: hypothetical protein [Nocardiopsis]MBB5491458.1 hypothetical protein [Nocardiopsis metallicus]USY18007.1 hypothetical protein NE857_22085 [Nocardiopsis exhalans]